MDMADVMQMQAPVAAVVKAVVKAAVRKAVTPIMVSVWWRMRLLALASSTCMGWLAFQLPSWLLLHRSAFTPEMHW